MNLLGLRNHIKRKFSSLRVSQICEILSLALAYPSYSHTFQVSPYLVEDVKIDYVAQQEEDEDEVDHVGDGMTIAATTFSPQPRNARPDVEEIEIYKMTKESSTSIVTQFHEAVRGVLVLVFECEAREHLLSFNSCVRAASCITRSWNIIRMCIRVLAISSLSIHVFELLVVSPAHGI